MRDRIRDRMRGEIVMRRTMIPLFAVAAVAALILLHSPMLSQVGSTPDRIVLRSAMPPAPSNVRASVIGAGNNAIYYYWVVARYAGGAVAVSPPATLRQGWNTIGVAATHVVSWDALVGTGLTYDLLRTTTFAFPQSGTCTCRVTLGTAATSVTDNVADAALAAYTLTGFSAQQVDAVFWINNRDYSPPRLELITPSTGGLNVTGPINSSGAVGLSGPLTGITSITMSGNLSMTAGTITSYGGQTTAGRGVSPILAAYSATAQAGAIAAGNLLAAAPAGMYRISSYIHTTTVAGGACTEDIVIGWTYNAGAKTETVITGHDLNADESSHDDASVIQVDAGANITRELTQAGGGCGGGLQRFDVYITLERLS